MAELKGVKFGKHTGPTGRERNLYTVSATNRWKEREGSRKAYGRDGVKEAKKTIHKDADKLAKRRIWLRFHTYNETRGRFAK